MAEAGASVQQLGSGSMVSRVTSAGLPRIFGWSGLTWRDEHGVGELGEEQIGARRGREKEMAKEERMALGSLGTLGQGRKGDHV